MIMSVINATVRIRCIGVHRIFQQYARENSENLFPCSSNLKISRMIQLKKESKETEFKELSKNRAYLLRMGDVEVSAIKLEGYKAIQLGGTLSPISVRAGGSKAEGDDWLLVVKNKNQITMPYEVWVNQMAQEIGKATGSNVNTISVASSAGLHSSVTIRRGIEEVKKKIQEAKSKK